jgi:hypothetical protein
MLRAHPDMEIDPTVPPFPFVQWDGKVVREIPQVRFKPGVDPAKVVFETGYDKAASASYDVFKRLQASGEIPRHTRFQVSLPTPHSSGYLYVSGPARRSYFDVYERCLKAALADIVKTIPAADLSIQWDVLPGSAGLRELLQGPPGRLQEADLRHAGPSGRCGAGRRRAWGYHLCYGSAGLTEHLVQPKDAGPSLVRDAGRHRRPPLEAAHRLLHIPVRKKRTDEGYLLAAQDWPRSGGSGAEPSSISGFYCITTTRPATHARRRVAGNSSTIWAVAECGWGRDPSGRAGC